MGNHHFDSLPRARRAPLDDLVKKLRALLEDKLEAVIVHGSAARGDYRPETSDLDVVIVLADTSRALLDRISDALALARASGRIEAMILSEEEILRAADVFRSFTKTFRSATPWSSAKIRSRAWSSPPRIARLRIGAGAS